MKKIMLFMFFLGFISFNQNIFCSIPNDYLTHLHQSGDSSIKEIKNGKVYLNYEKIFITENGIFLNTDCIGYVLIPYITQDTNGINTGYFSGFKCKNCQTFYRDQPKKCEVCGNDSFDVVDFFHND